MTFNNLAKKIFVLMFLLAVLVVIFIWQGDDFNQGYLSWLKTGIVKVNPFNRMIGPELKLAEDSGLDLSNVNIEEIIADQEKPAQISEEVEAGGEGAEEPVDNSLNNQAGGEEVIIGIGGPIEPAEEVVVVSEKKMSLEDIEQEINKITKEVERIDKNVQALVALL